ncbi:MAG: DoxX family protein [Gammaproteobacteria bacterium]|nr:DoxX family protein [Gammaproteobacteria bacterium]
MAQKIGALWVQLLGYLKPIDGIPPLLARLYLTPVMLQAGYTKLVGFDNTVSWFESMGMPLPVVSVALVALSEFVGGFLLLIGWLTRLVCIPLMIAMLVAAFAVHGENGWLTLSDGNSWLANERVIEAQEQKREIRRLMREHGDYRWLTSNGNMTILNNGMQLAITYFLFLLILLFTGGGRYTSLDYWLGNWLKPRLNTS